MGGKYTFIDFENGSGETILAVICVLLIFATGGFIYIKRRMRKRKMTHQMEMNRLRTANRSVEDVPSSECKIQPDYQVSVFDPQVAKRHMEEVKKQSALFGSRMDLLEARVFRVEI